LQSASQSAAPPQLVRRIAEDRDGFIKDLRAPHGPGK